MMLKGLKFSPWSLVSDLFASKKSAAPSKEAQSSGGVLICGRFTNRQRVFVAFDLRDDFPPSDDTDKELVNMPGALAARPPAGGAQRHHILTVCLKETHFAPFYSCKVFRATTLIERSLKIKLKEFS